MSYPSPSVYKSEQKCSTTCLAELYREQGSFGAKVRNIQRAVNRGIFQNIKNALKVCLISQAALQTSSFIKVFLKIYSKFTGEHPCRRAFSINLQSKFIEIALRHGCSPVNLMYIFKNTFLKQHQWRGACF